MVNETEEPKMSVLDETKAAIAQLGKEREEADRAIARLEQLKSDQLLSGTAGARIEPTPAKEETPQEYVEKIERGEFNKK